jgi:hypothetical protein
MPIKSLSSRELNQDLGRAKRAAKSGRPAYVLSTFEDHQKTQDKKFVSLLDAIAMPEDDIEWEDELPVGGFYHRHVDFD